MVVSVGMVGAGDRWAGRHSTEAAGCMRTLACFLVAQRPLCGGQSVDMELRIGECTHTPSGMDPLQSLGETLRLHTQQQQRRQ